MGWALQVPHWTQHGSWGFEPECLWIFGTRQLWPVMGRSHPFHPQRLIRHGQGLLLLISLLWSESIHVFHCSSPPCSPPAGTKPPNLAVHYRGEGNMTVKYKKGRNNGFLGKVSFIWTTVSYTRSKLTSWHVSYIKRKPKRRNTDFFFFCIQSNWMEDFLKFNNQSIFILLQISFPDALSIFWKKPTSISFKFLPLITKFHTWNNDSSTWMCLKSHFTFRCRKTGWTSIASYQR